MEPPGPVLAGGVEPQEAEPRELEPWEMEPHPFLCICRGQAEHPPQLQGSDTCLPCPEMPLPPWLLAKPALSRHTPSFPFHGSANLGSQNCLMGFPPISAAQLWRRMASEDWLEVGTELGATSWAAEAPLHTNPICSPLCRLLRLCFLESNLHFVSPLWPL